MTRLATHKSQTDPDHFTQAFPAALFLTPLPPTTTTTTGGGRCCLDDDDMLLLCTPVMLVLAIGDQMRAAGFNRTGKTSSKPPKIQIRDFS